VPEREYDYVIVGSGAGGGTLAARLAETQAVSVCLLEAGGDPLWGRADPTLPEDYEVPAFHPFASENPAMRWDFYVRHYRDAARQAADPKCRPDPLTGEPSIYYPRAATLGGCTAHNAMIFAYPHDSDWEGIRELTGDTSWSPSEMEKYARRIEDCRHRPVWRFLRRFGFDLTGHGWDGWLTTEIAIPRQAFRDGRLLRLVFGAAAAEIFGTPGWLAKIWRLIQNKADPNDRRWLASHKTGPCFTPLTTRRHRRGGVRERVLDVARRYPDRLHIVTNALATRVLFAQERLANGDLRIRGVEYLEGERLYKAHPGGSGTNGTRQVVHARREVILAGGAFNTPQLLMLSGIGPEADLAARGIEVAVPLEGVGSNLQDRYEVGVVHRAKEPWKSLRGARFQKGDPLYRQWEKGGNGFYGSNGVALAFSMQSDSSPVDPDLFCIAVLGRFTGYYPGYSRDVPKHLDTVSFVLLKAHTQNRRGKVVLRSNDPLVPPEIDFHYFEEGSDTDGRDLRAVVEGVEAIRRITRGLVNEGLLLPEDLPGEDLTSGNDGRLEQFIRDNAWGHHACGTCAIGPRDMGGVLASDFKVHGTSGLRVVDASVFPRIPGFFIASAILMIAEKAADDILRDAGMAIGDVRDRTNKKSPVI
jgi:choline dehydrogenase